MSISEIEKLTIACNDLFHMELALGPDYANIVARLADIREELRLDLAKAWEEHDNTIKYIK